MAILQVPYHRQINSRSCGIAAFQMVYDFYGSSLLSTFSQADTYKKLEERTPDGRDVRVSTDSIVQLAIDHSFSSAWGRVSPDPARMVTELEFFLGERIPLIVCQRAPGDPKSGHFRVVTGVDRGQVIFHDPGHGPACRIPVIDFFEQWKPSPGRNVTGGVAIWIKGQPVINSPLGPHEPNPWDNI